MLKRLLQILAASVSPAPGRINLVLDLPPWKAWIVGKNLAKSSSPEVFLMGYDLMMRVVEMMQPNEPSYEFKAKALSDMYLDAERARATVEESRQRQFARIQGIVS